MAPPFTLTFSGSSSSLRTQYTHMEAKASLIYSHQPSLSRPDFSCPAYLEEIYIFLCKANLCQDFRNGNSWTNAHDTRRQAWAHVVLIDRPSDHELLTCDSRVDILGKDSKPQIFGLLP